MTSECFIAPNVFGCERPCKVDWFCGFIAACLQLFCFCLHGLQPSVRDSILFLINWHLLVVQREGCINIYVYVCVWVCVDWLSPSSTPRECSPSYAYKQSLEILLTQSATTRRGVCVCACMCVFINMCLCLWICLLHHAHTHTHYMLCAMHISDQHVL